MPASTCATGTPAFRATTAQAIVEVTSPADLNGYLTSHPATARALVDVTCEAVNNAILRAGATRIHAVVAPHDVAVTVAVTNDVTVSTPMDSRGPGLGSALFDELTDEWSLRSGAGQAEFTAVISFPHRGSTGTPVETRPEAAGFRVIADKSV